MLKLLRNAAQEHATGDDPWPRDAFASSSRLLPEVASLAPEPLLYDAFGRALVPERRLGFRRD